MQNPSILHRVSVNSHKEQTLLMHLAAADVYYGLNTFDGVPWGRFSYEARKKWGVAINLGETARVRYKGFDLQYYLSHLFETREHTTADSVGFAR